MVQSAKKYGQNLSFGAIVWLFMIQTAELHQFSEGGKSGWCFQKMLPGFFAGTSVHFFLESNDRNRASV